MGQTMQMGVREPYGAGGASSTPPHAPCPQSPFSPLRIPKALLKGDEAHFYGADHVDWGSLQPYGAGGGNILNPPPPTSPKLLFPFMNPYSSS